MRSPEYFARFVLEVVSRMDRVACYEQGGPHPSLIWPEMGEYAWREAALIAIDKTRVHNAKFVEPTEVSDWVFIAERRPSVLS